MAQLDYGALGFTLTVADTADVLEIEPQEVRHLLLTGDLAGVFTSTGEFAPLAVALHPDEVAAYARLRRARAQTVVSRNRSRALKLLDRYLRDIPASEDYDRAIVDSAPLLACSGHELATHVRLESVTAYQQRLDPAATPVSTSMLAEALERAGGVRRKGVVAAADRGGSKARQRWGTWWRIPAALLPEASGDELARQVVAGAIEPGEKVKVGRDGHVYLADPLDGDEG